MCVVLFYTKDGVLVVAAALKPPQLLSASPKEMGKAFKLQTDHPKEKALCVLGLSSGGRRVMSPPQLSESTAARASMCCPQKCGRLRAGCLQLPVSNSARVEPLGTPGTSACPEAIDLLNARFQQLQLHSCPQGCVEVRKLPEGEGPVA